MYIYDFSKTTKGIIEEEDGKRKGKGNIKFSPINKNPVKK
jgi:hypothetical protein